MVERTTLPPVLRLLLAPLNALWKRSLQRGLADARTAALALTDDDNLARLAYPPVAVSRRATKEQELDFLRWRSATYFGPMSDGVVDETIAALFGRNAPAPADAHQLAEICSTCTAAYLGRREGTRTIIDFAQLTLFPYRPETVSQFIFDLEAREFSVVDVGGATHRPGDSTWETALAHVMCWITIAAPSGAHNWVHFGFPDACASVHNRMRHRDTVLWKLLAPHLRFTNRINYQALWIQRSSDNGHSLRQRLTPWLAMPYHAEQFRGGILRNTTRHYRDLPAHFDLPLRLDPAVPYFRFLRAYYDVVERFVARLELEDDAWNEFASGVDADFPGFARIVRERALAVLLWQVGVVHLADHASFVKHALHHGFCWVPHTLHTPYTFADVGRWDRWRTRNFLKTFVAFHPHPDLDQRLLNVEAYGFSGDAAVAAEAFRADLLALDARLGPDRIVPVEAMVQSVCF